jgi:hypothetical protein
MNVELLKTVGFPAFIALYLLVDRRTVRKEWRKERKEWRQSLDEHTEAVQQQTRMFRRTIDAPAMRTDGGDSEENSDDR